MSNVVHFSDASFKSEVLESAVPVLIDFWAPWCSPCRAIAPLVEEVANQFEGKLKVGKINVDEDTRVAAEYHIAAIPTLLVFKNGKVVDQIVGAVAKNKLIAFVEKHLA